MKLKDVGEARILDWVSEYLGTPASANVPVGVGDDAAVIKLGNTYLAFCSDMIHDGSDIYNGMMPYHAGRKVAVVNFSDLASMGAKPAGFLLSLSMSQEDEFTKLKEIMRGVKDACTEYGARFLGGDLDKGDTLIMDGCAFGTICKKSEIMTRAGAKPGDVVAVTGYLGSAACGWQVQQKGLGLAVFGPEKKKRIEAYIVKASTDPKARVREGRILANSGVKTCTDISDGLARSLGNLRGPGGESVGFEIYEKDVPVRKELGIVCDRFGLDKYYITYHVGEDFELLCTMSPMKFAAVKKKLPGLRRIGVVTKGTGIRLIKKDGSSTGVKPTGYNHFSKV